MVSCGRFTFNLNQYTDIEPYVKHPHTPVFTSALLSALPESRKTLYAMDGAAKMA